MKSFLCVLLCIGLVSAETCMEVNDCTHGTCDSETTMSCIRGECTCATDDEASGGFGPGGAAFGDGPFPTFGDFGDVVFPSFPPGPGGFSPGEFPSFSPVVFPSIAPVGKK